MKVTLFNDEVQKRRVSVEIVRCSFEKEISNGVIWGIITPNKTEAFCFESHEIEALIAELSSGKISLANLSEQLNLTVYQISLVLRHLLKKNQIDGELTYNTFTSRAALKKTSLQKAAEHKRTLRIKMKNK